MERIFHLKENGTSVKTEILAGLTTFMTMAYIIALNPNLLTSFAVGHAAVERRVPGHLHRLRHRHRLSWPSWPTSPLPWRPAWASTASSPWSSANIAAMTEHRLHQRLPGGAVHHPGGGHRFPRPDHLERP